MGQTISGDGMIKIDTNENDMWERIIDYYFDHVWPGGSPSIVTWVEEEYNCRMNDNIAVFNNPEAATLFQLRWM